MHCDLEKLDMYGTDYLFSLAEKSQKDELFKLYMSEASKLLLEITASFKNAKIEFPRYMDFLYPEKKKEKKQKTAEQIIDDVTKNAGLEVIE